MRYEYTHLIPENVAPKGATGIVVMKTDTDGTPIRDVCSIPKPRMGDLAPPEGELILSFGLAGDIHLWITDGVSWHPNTKFDSALSFFEAEGCAFCVVCGDLTQTGFYRKINESDPDEVPYLEELQMAKYKEICGNHPNLPVYEIAGNHESYYNMPITSNLDKWEAYTGRRDLSYTVTYGDLVLVFLGEPNQSEAIESAGKTLLQGLLNDPANEGKRFLVFVHSYLEEDSGDPHDYRENSIFTAAARTEFIDLLKGRDTLILFHAHSHMAFELQEGWPTANYTDANGFKSVHIPSLSRPRGINHEGTTDKEKTPNMDDQSQAYVVDVYPDCIYLRGRDLVNDRWVGIGTYKINT